MVLDIALALLSTASADPPDHVALLLDIQNPDGAEVERLALSQTGNVVAGRTRGDLAGWMVDIDGWILKTFGGTAEGCDVTGVAPRGLSDGDEQIWMSCGDGSVRVKHWNGVTLFDETSLDDSKVIAFEGVAETLSGIWFDANADLLYALHVPEGAPGVLHVVDPSLLLVDTQVSASWPKTLMDDEFVEGVITTTGQLIIAHGGESLSVLDLATDGFPVPNIHTGVVACNDLAASPFGGAYCVGSSGVGGLGTLSEFRPTTNKWTALGGLGELLDPNAVCANLEFDDNGLDDGWLAITGLQVKVWTMADDGSFPTSTPYFQGPDDADNKIIDMVTDDGYLYGGGTAGRLHIVTARPWVSGMTVDPVTARDGDTVTVTFSADTAVDWDLRLGGSRLGEGQSLKTGSAPMDTDVSVDVEVQGQFEEGNNYLYAHVTDVDGLTGHGRATLNVDNPPQPPVLNAASLGFADGGLILGFDGIDDADLDHYEVWVSTAPFAPADFPSEGPAWDGSTSLKTPIKIPGTPGALVSYRIQPLENGVTYWVGVHAFDANQEGPMSKVVSGKPRVTMTAAELAGDPGGAPCSTGPSPGAWWLGAAIGALGLRRRSRAAMLAVPVLLGSATAANAADEKDPWWKADQTDATANFELRYGVIFLEDQRINDVYRNNPTNLLNAELGPQIYRFGEVDFGVGFFQELAYAVTPGDLLQSSDRTMMTWYPLYLDATARAHILDEQPVVPFARYGWDYVIWSERADNASGGKDVLQGGKFGTHTGVGVNILLDLLQRPRASFLEARTGINDSWLTIEWRHQSVDGRLRPWSGPSADSKLLSFSGNAVQAGLKLDW